MQEPYNYRPISTVAVFLPSPRFCFFAVQLVRLSYLEVLHQEQLDLLFHLEDILTLIHKASLVLWTGEESQTCYPPWVIYT